MEDVMRRVLAVLLAPLLGGCSLVTLARPDAGPVASPPGEVVAVIRLEDGETIWPDVEMQPGDYRVDWRSDCPVSLNYYGATLITSDDPPTGTRLFTIEPNQYGLSLFQACFPDDTMEAIISRP